MFTTHFVPILQKYVGSLKNPWVTEGLVRPMQIIWDGVMQDWPHTFTEDDDKIYRLVSAHPLSLPTITLTTPISHQQCMQKIYDWRTQFGKAALDAVEAHWASDAKYCNSLLRKDYVEEALSPGLPFMYGCIEALDELGTIQVRAVCKQGNLLTFRS